VLDPDAGVIAVTDPDAELSVLYPTVLIIVPPYGDTDA
jgi:hypothetical protein